VKKELDRIKNESETMKELVSFLIISVLRVQKFYEPNNQVYRRKKGRL